MLRWAGSFAAVIIPLALTAGVVNFAPPPELGRSNLAACSLELGGFQGRDVPVEEFVMEELDPSDMLMRSYSGSHPKEGIWLIIAYFENARYGAHNPEVCYRSQGWQIEDLPEGLLQRNGQDPVPAVRFKVKRRREERLVMYWWYISESLAMGDQRKFLDSMALQGILRGSNYGSFVRVSTPVWPNEEEASARLQRFGQQVMDELPRLFSKEAS